MCRIADDSNEAKVVEKRSESMTKWSMRNEE